jgi:hypothetical protein
MPRDTHKTDIKLVKPHKRSNGAASARIPLTITLGAESLKFIESCAQRKEFRNVDDLFESALITYQRQSDALRAYIEMQIDKGHTREEILQSVRVEIVITRPRRKLAKRVTRR